MSAGLIVALLAAAGFVLAGRRSDASAAAAGERYRRLEATVQRARAGVATPSELRNAAELAHQLGQADTAERLLALAGSLDRTPAAPPPIGPEDFADIEPGVTVTDLPTAPPRPALAPTPQPLAAPTPQPRPQTPPPTPGAGRPAIAKDVEALKQTAAIARNMHQDQIATSLLSIAARLTKGPPTAVDAVDVVALREGARINRQLGQDATADRLVALAAALTSAHAYNAEDVAALQQTAAIASGMHEDQIATSLLSVAARLATGAPNPDAVEMLALREGARINRQLGQDATADRLLALAAAPRAA